MFIITHSFCGSESRSGLAGWSWLRVSHGVTAKTSAGAGHLKVAWGWRATSKRAQPHAVKLELVFGCRLQLLTTWTSPEGCLSVLMTCSGILPDEWRRREPSESLNVSSDLPWRSPSDMFVTPLWSYRWALSAKECEYQEVRITLETGYLTHGINNEVYVSMYN